MGGERILPRELDYQEQDVENDLEHGTDQLEIGVEDQKMIELQQLMEEFAEIAMAKQINGERRTVSGSYQLMEMCPHFKDPTLSVVFIRAHMEMAAEQYAEYEVENKTKVNKDENLKVNVEEKASDSDEGFAKNSDAVDTKKIDSVKEMKNEATKAEEAKVSAQATEGSHDATSPPDSSGMTENNSRKHSINVVKKDYSGSDTVVKQQSPDAVKGGSVIIDKGVVTSEVLSNKNKEGSYVAEAKPQSLRVDAEEIEDSQTQSKDSEEKGGGSERSEDSIEEIQLEKPIESIFEESTVMDEVIINEQIDEEIDLIVAPQFDQYLERLQTDELIEEDNRDTKTLILPLASTEEGLSQIDDAEGIEATHTITLQDVLVEVPEEDKTVITQLHDVIEHFSHEMDEIDDTSELTGHEERNDKVYALYQCLDAQLRQISDEEIEQYVQENKLPKEIELTLETLFEEIGVNDPELMMRLYVQQYGAQDLFDITQVTNSKKSIRSKRVIRQRNRIAQLVVSLLHEKNVNLSLTA